MNTITGKIKKIAGKAIGKGKKGFLLEGDDEWFTAFGGAVTYLDKMKEGDEITIEYEQKGVFRNVSKISKTTEQTKPEVKDVPAFTCEDCGAALKDGKYKKCYKCNQKAPATANPPEEKKEKNNFTPSNKDIQIQRGNSLAVAGNVLKGNFEGTNTDIETIKQATLNLAESFLDWLRIE